MAKIGEGSLAAWGRLGLKELRNAVNPSRESVADSELGMFGTATQREINTERGQDGGATKPLSMDDLRARVRGAEAARDERGRDDREVERGGIEM
jgi:DNA-binding response OmpR family regulator